jgi:two-component system, NarL family, nitrate/nitrite response regulator NarL
MEGFLTGSMRILADDNPSIRRAVRSALGQCGDVETIGEASNGEDAIAQTNPLSPDLVIMDVSMPVLDGLTAAELIKRYHPDTSVLMFTMYKLREFIDTAKDLGLNGFISKDVSVPALIEAIEAVRNHETYFPS